MNREDVVAQLQAIGAANGQDADDMLACTVDEMTLLARGYRESVEAREQTDLDKFITWLELAARIAGPVATIAAALVAVAAVPGAAKAL